jgi:hypothetical protein
VSVGVKEEWPPLPRIVFRLRVCVRVIQEKRSDFLKRFLADVHRAVDAIARLNPIHFSNRHLPLESFSAIAELDGEQVAAQDDGHTMKGIAMPGRRLARRQALPPDQVIPAMMQHLLISRPFHN